MSFGDKVIVSQILRLASKGLIPNRLIIRIVVTILGVLAKKTDNELDDKIVATVKKLLVK